MIHKYSIALLAFITLSYAALSTPARAQCFVDDGFVLPGACCAPVNPMLPNFPSMTIPSEYCCFRNCQPTLVLPELIQLTQPFPFFCDIYLIQMQTIGALNLQPGLLIAKYSRTWEELNPITQRQVWRFLINGDFKYTIPVGALPPCPFPATAFLNMPVHFVGSLDYARDCVSGQWSASINLTHLCGDFMHNGFSANPMSANPNQDFVYSFMGPAPINWGVAAPPSGPIIGDSVRETNASLVANPLLWKCLSELPLVGGQIQNIANYCACEDPNNPSAPAWTQQQIQFSYGCVLPGNNNWGQLPYPPILPTGLSAMGLGSYTGGPFVYPGNEEVSLYFGLSFAPAPCTNAFPVHLVTGVGTVGGDIAIVHSPYLTGAPYVTDKFLDLENMLILIQGPPYMVIGLGGFFLSTELWQINTQ